MHRAGFAPVTLGDEVRYLREDARRIAAPPTGLRTVMEEARAADCENLSRNSDFQARPGVVGGAAALTSGGRA
ncbi:hypothetical protein [Streptomyces sp. HC307]|uniref:hypothetical protein n=1 Tax=Streptomyces flavusporus TaxID=3385496 RepID=UPI00391755DC